MNRLLAVSFLCLVVVAGVFAQSLPAPTNLTAVQVNENSIRVRLTWDAPDSIRSFKIYRSVNDTSHFVNIGMTTNTTARVFYDHMVVVGTRYYYFVRSVRGSVMSEPSNIADILITTPPPPPPPPTPTNLTAMLVPPPPGVFGVAVKLMWNGGRGPWTYRVYRSVEDTLHFNTVGNTPDTTFIDHGVHAGHYYYYVKAFGMNGGVSDPSNIADIVVVAPPRVQGTIMGTVIDDSTAAPIRNVYMQFFRLAGPTMNCPPSVVTDSLGHYSALLDTGRYVIRANPRCEHNTSCYRPEYFDNCPEPACATVIALAESATFVANFGLSRPTPLTYTYVSGTVSDTANNPLRHARVSLLRTVREMNYLASLGLVPGTRDEEFEIEGLGRTRGVLWTGWTDSLGHYRARVIANRDYFAVASKAGYLPQYYDHQSTVATADTIHVGTGEVTGIDFNLSIRPVPNNSISGSVVDSMGTGVVSRIVVLPARGGHPGPSVTRYFHTDSLGNYTILGLEAGKYFVLAIPFSNYAPAFYKVNGCGIIHIRDADTVNVTGNVTGINVCVLGVHNNGLTLVRGVIRSTTNTPVVGVRVTAFDAQGQIAGIGLTNGSGMYELNAIAPGIVTVVADREGYNSAQTPVTVYQNVYALDNVNITMSPNSPTSVNPDVVPSSFALDQNYPNPFNPSTKISYAISTPGSVTLEVYNVLGQVVATLFNGNSAAGTFEVTWNGKDDLGRAVSSGVYIYKLHATSGPTEFTQARKMLLLK